MARNGHPITIGKHKFSSLTEAGRYFGRSTPNIAYHRDNGTLESILVEEKSHAGTDEPITIRGVRYRSMSAAADALGVSISAISRARSRDSLESVGAKNLFK